MKDEWRKLKRTFLSEKSKYGNVTHYMIPTMWHHVNGNVVKAGKESATTKSRESNQTQITGDLKTVEVTACLYNDRHISPHTRSNLQDIQTPRKALTKERDFGVIIMSQSSWLIAGVLSVRCWQWRGLCPCGGRRYCGKVSASLPLMWSMIFKTRVNMA